MWPVTDRYLDTIARPHAQRVYLEIIRDGQKIGEIKGSFTDPDTGNPLYLLDGAVQVDKTTIRRSAQITLLDPVGSYLPDSVGDLLSPYVTELRPWVGVRYWDALLPALSTTVSGSGNPVLQTETEYVPVGTLVITELDDSSFPELHLQCYDRMWLPDRFTAPYTVAAGTDPIDALSDLLGRNVPPARLETNFAVTTENTTPALTFDAESDIPDGLMAIADSVGLVLYVDPMGVFTTGWPASTEDDPVQIYRPQPHSVMFRPRRGVGGTDQLYNAVVATGEGGTSAPVRGYAQDDDPSSMTYVGRIGTRTLFYSSPQLTTVDQCNLAARTRLASVLGVANAHTIPILANHALESGDVVEVIDDQAGTDERVIVDAFSVPLKGSRMDLVSRAGVLR
jgi:hypothetical protein